ncbi:hypothetical protein GE278_21680 (plasmid) [Enterobacteriaceae bacterium Kacie_13]|nr:hypothetical protein GE278_21680 [Enterobacteriaceae bacterium Kacie_13]
MYRCFGLDVTESLLPLIWPKYALLAQQSLVQPAKQQLIAALTSATPGYLERK